jgi:GAF domain-containing protein
VSTASERLQVLYDLSRRLASFDDLDALLRDATRAVREQFRADGVAILLLDEAGRELRFPVASQAEGIGQSIQVLTELRFPATQGIAGWVVAHGEPAAIDDVTTDPRHYAGVARATGITTRALLAAPINPGGGRFAPDDVAFLQAVASDIGIAYEKTDLYAQLHHEVRSLRDLTRLSGIGLVAVGILLLALATFANLAFAMPWDRMLTRPGFWVGLLTTLVGGLLVQRSRR